MTRGERREAKRQRARYGMKVTGTQCPAPAGDHRREGD